MAKKILTASNIISNITNIKYDEDREIISCRVKTGVECIAEEAFTDLDFLEKIELPKTVTSFSDNAFDLCLELKEINIPENVLEISDSCFINCESIESIVLPQKLIKLGKSSFQRCDSLKEIEIPENIRTIPDNCFNNCRSLKNIIFKGVITTIGDSAFCGAYELENVDFPDGLIYIMDFAFGDCRKLKEISLPSSVKVVGTQAFEGCGSLKKIVFNSSNIEIKERAFCSTGIDSLVLPSGIKVVPKESFMSCSNLQEIIFPEGLEVIGEAAFSGCRNLSVLNIPSSIKRIENNAFKNCKNIKEVILPQNLEFLGKDAFDESVKLINHSICNNKISFNESDNIDMFNANFAINKVELSKVIEMAENGVLQAQKYLFWYFYSGKNGNRDVEKALYWLMKYKNIPIDNISEDTKMLMLKNNFLSVAKMFDNNDLEKLDKQMRNQNVSKENRKPLNIDRKEIVEKLRAAIEALNVKNIAETVSLLIESWEEPSGPIKKECVKYLDEKIDALKEKYKSNGSKYVQEEINRLGISFKRQGDYSDAIYCYYKAIPVNPMDQDAYYNLGKSYYLKKEWLYSMEAYWNCYKKIHFAYDDYLLSHVGHAFLDGFVGTNSDFSDEVSWYRDSISGRGSSTKGLRYDNLCEKVGQCVFDYYRKTGAKYLTEEFLSALAGSKKTIDKKEEKVVLVESDPFTALLRKIEKIRIGNYEFDCQTLTAHNSAVKYGDQENDATIGLRIMPLAVTINQPKQLMLHGDFSSVDKCLDNMKTNIDEFIQDNPRVFISYCTFASTYYNYVACKAVYDGNNDLATKCFLKSIVFDLIYDSKAFDLRTVDVEEKYFIQECSALSNLSKMVNVEKENLFALFDYADIAGILINYLIYVSKLNCMSEFGVAAYLKIISNLIEIAHANNTCDVNIAVNYPELYNWGNSYLNKDFKIKLSDNKWNTILPLLKELGKQLNENVSVDILVEQIFTSL